MTGLPHLLRPLESGRVPLLSITPTMSPSMFKQWARRSSRRGRHAVVHGGGAEPEHYKGAHPLQVQREGMHG